MKYIIFLFVFLLVSCNSNKTNPLGKSVPNGMAYIEGGVLNMGGDNDQAEQNEFPKHKVKIKPFLMDATEVTNAAFNKFVDETGYVTVAERTIDWAEMKAQLPPNTPKPADSLLQPGALVFIGTEKPVPLNDPSKWWEWTVGANWQHPEGPNSDILDKMDHPVVQIAWEDANAFCKWAGKRLPTEAEWEWAARGGKENMVYPWGNESINKGDPKANYFQGLFPVENTMKDGFETTAPVNSFEPNEYGLYDMSGNVWEWCEDWYNVAYYQQNKDRISTASGPEQAYNPMMPYQQEKVIRGGSFLCTDDYCSGYRNSRRMGSTMDTGLNHTGFRCVQDVK